MAKIEYEICDRCKKKIVGGCFAKVNRTVSTRFILGFGPYDYCDTERTLCKDCSKELTEFLRGEGKPND